MKLPLSWLREFVQIDADADEISHRLSIAGLEVENIERLTPGFAGVTVGRILTVERHPNADRLSLCEVDAGELGHFRVVCGAPNVRPGMVAPLARVGARLGTSARKRPDGTQSLDDVVPLQAAEIRGVRSEGMLCSGRELGLSEDHSGILDLEHDAPLGGDFARYLELDETIFDIAITPNRGDCLSILGLAREVSALFGLKLKVPRRKVPVVAPGECPDIEIHASDLCRRYAGLPMGGIRIGKSPQWLRRRLELCGMRGVNNVVDITNYVMLEMGQPLHAFDLDKIQGGKIVVRRAGDDRQFTTLDDAQRELNPADLLIADGVRPLAIAGVMGGQDSEVSGETSRILLESAYFEPMTVARTARRLGLRSEASYRFERGIDRAGQVTAITRAAELIRRLTGGRELAPVRDVEPEVAPAREIHFDLRRAAALLGFALPRGEIRRRLIAIGATVHNTGKDRLGVIPPSFRPDLNEPADLAEEIGRLKGYEEVPDQLPVRPSRVIPGEPARRFTASAKDAMLGCGLTELRTIAFIAPDDNRRFPGLTSGSAVVVANPLSADLSELRMSLLPGLLAALRFNLNRQATALHAFEIAKTFHQQGDFPAEGQRLAALSYGAFVVPSVGVPAIEAGFFTLKGILETWFRSLGILDQVTFPASQPNHAPFLHPGKSAEVRLGEHRIGVIGELHPQEAFRMELGQPCALFELDFAAIAAYARPAKPVEPPPRFPAVRRDLALVIDREVPAATVIDTVRQINLPLLESVELFDVYTGEGIPPDKKSMALSLRYRARERTLTDEEVNQAHENLVRLVLTHLGAQMRQ
ncbi:MAG: phenylalanine--tRNA ligase subunit beta [Candidatus Binataceae bacterium]